MPDSQHVGHLVELVDDCLRAASDDVAIITISRHVRFAR